MNTYSIDTINTSRKDALRTAAYALYQRRGVIARYGTDVFSTRNGNFATVLYYGERSVAVFNPGKFLRLLDVSGLITENFRWMLKEILHVGISLCLFNPNAEYMLLDPIYLKEMPDHTTFLDIPVQVQHKPVQILTFANMLEAL